MELSDEELILRIAEGDFSFLAALYGRYKSRLMTYASYVLADRSAAEDIVQETFIRAFKHAGRFKQGKRFSTWIYSIAANLCRDEMRRKKRRRAVSLPLLGDAAEGHLTARMASPLRGAARREFAERLRAEIQALSPEQREVIVLHYLESMKYTEIAEVARCPIGTVQSRLHAGLMILRERLRDFRIDGGGSF